MKIRLFDSVKKAFAWVPSANFLDAVSFVGVPLIWLGLALLLSGCVTTRYVTISCLSKDQQLPPEPPKIHGQLSGQADKDLKIVAGSAIRLRAWGEGFQTILEGCREK